MPARLKFTIEAPESADPVPFDAFAETAGHVAGLLAELDAAPTGEPTLRWVIRSLRAGSPAVVEIEAVPLNPMLDMSDRLTRDLATGLSTVATERRRPDAFTDAAWVSTQALVGILHDGVARLSIEAGSAPPVVLTGEVILAEDEPELGLTASTEVAEQQAISTIEGSLDNVHGHGSQPFFELWDVIYRRRVRCDFDPSLLPDVRRGLLERVRVNGRVMFDRLGHPMRVVEVLSITVLERTVQRPGPHDLRGLAPDLTGGLSAADWVRRIRDA